jgi:hypothetical protein
MERCAVGRIGCSDLCDAVGGVLGEALATLRRRSSSLKRTALSAARAVFCSFRVWVGTTNSLADLVIVRLGLTPGGRLAGFAAKLLLSFASSAAFAASEEYGSSSAVGVGGGTSGTGAFSGTVSSEVSFVINPLLESPSMVLGPDKAKRAGAKTKEESSTTFTETRKTTTVVGKDSFHVGYSGLGKLGFRRGVAS